MSIKRKDEKDFVIECYICKKTELLLSKDSNITPKDAGEIFSHRGWKLPDGHTLICFCSKRCQSIRKRNEYESELLVRIASGGNFPIRCIKCKDIFANTEESVHCIVCSNCTGKKCETPWEYPKVIEDA